MDNDEHFISKLGFFALLIATVATGLYVSSSFESKIISGLNRIEPAAGAAQESGQSDLIATFSLTDHNGNPVTGDSYAGHYRLVFFGFSHCSDTCPTALKKMARALEILGKDGEGIQPLFISVDPETDTPAVLKDYVGLFHPRLTGLTGTTEQVEGAEHAFRVYAAKRQGENPDDYTVDHSGFTYLQDPRGKLVGFFETEESADEMATEIRKLMAQQG